AGGCAGVTSACAGRGIEGEGAATAGGAVSILPASDFFHGPNCTTATSAPTAQRPPTATHRNRCDPFGCAAVTGAAATGTGRGAGAAGFTVAFDSAVAVTQITEPRT